MAQPGETKPGRSFTMLDAALSYLDDAWSIFPVCCPVVGQKGRCIQHGNCESPGKVPLVSWKPFQQEIATIAMAQYWWGPSRWPTANIGLVTGELSDVVVIDIDGEVAAADVERRGYDPGPWTSTGRVGGRHIYCRWREDAPRNFTKVGGLDYRGEGGYVLLPPSLHHSGARYHWQQPVMHPEPLPNLPRWVDELAATKTDGGPREKIDFDKLLSEGVAEGKRDEMLFRAAARLRGADVPYELAVELVQRMAARCQPPFDEQEAQRKVDSAYGRYQPNEQPGVYVFEDDPEAVELAAVPDFPVEVLPSQVESLVVESQLPPALVAGAALVAMAVAIGGNVSLQVMPAWVERPIVWAALLAPRGAGKSPSMQVAFAPLRERDAQSRLKYVAQKSEWLRQKPSERGAAPINPALLHGDTTLEAHARRLEEAPTAPLVVDELSSLIQSLNEYKSRGAGGDRGRFLALWDGAAWSYTRVGRATTGIANGVDIQIAEPTVAVCGGLQTLLHPLLGDDIDGARPRWLPHLVAMPPHVRHRSGPVPGAWTSLLLDLLYSRDKRRQWYLDDAGLDRFQDWQDAWKQQAEQGGEGPSVSGALIKADRQLARVALIIAEALSPGQGGPVGEEIVDRAALWVDFTINCWRALPEVDGMSLSRKDEVLDRAVPRLLDWLEQHGGSASKRELLRGHVAGVRTADDLKSMLTRYEETYPGTIRSEPTGMAGRPPTRVYAPQRKAHKSPVATKQATKVATNGAAPGVIYGDLSTSTNPHKEYTPSSENRSPSQAAVETGDKPGLSPVDKAVEAYERLGQKIDELTDRAALLRQSGDKVQADRLSQEARDILEGPYAQAREALEVEEPR